MTRRRPRAWVGTCGWSYPDWRGGFYPHGLPRRKWLAWYATRFPAVELDASFYRFPNDVAVAAWNRELPEGFVLTAKGHRKITHVRRLREDPDLLEAFERRMARIRDLRVLVWQLPPSFRPDDETVARLDAFLGRLDPRRRHAVEFRHEGWWELPRVRRVLRSHRVAFVGVSHPDLPAEFPVTTDFLYLRFHGTGPVLYDHDYSDAELRTWVDRVAPALRRRRLYAFFDNTATVAAVENARRFGELLRDAGVEVARPKAD